nr:cyclic nucleotide-binding domain-containing protein [uncultured Holophaga sp.]
MINTSFLTESVLFRNLDETERAQVLVIGQVLSCVPDQVIFKEGDAGDGLFIVISGTIRISKHTPTGEEALAILEPNAFFGEMALIDYMPRAASAIANETCELFFIPLKDLRGLIETHHRIALKFLFALCEVLTQRLRETNERYMNIFTIAQWGGSGVANQLIPLP